jgi:ABC-type branched-subunit amino acid transport system substrate-binding protein
LSNEFSKALETYLMRVEFAYAVSDPATVETLTASSTDCHGEAKLGAQRVVAGHTAPLMGRIADSGKQNENGAQLAVEHITTEGQAARSPRNAAAELRAILTRINRVLPDVSESGGMDTTGGQPAQQAAGSGIRAPILGGDGVWTARVGERAANASRHPVRAEAPPALSQTNRGTGFDQQAEDRSSTPVQIDAPFAHEVQCAFVDAMKRANSFDAPKVLAAMPSTGYGVAGHIAIDHEGDLKEGAITLYDFRDSEAAVLDAVEM